MLNIKKLLTQILNALSVQVPTFTKAQSASTSHVLVRRVGHVIIVYGYITGVTLSSSDAIKIGTITASGYLPADSVRTYCNVGANAYSVGTVSYLALSPQGELLVKTSNTGSGKAVYFNFSYIR